MLLQLDSTFYSNTSNKGLITTVLSERVVGSEQTKQKFLLPITFSFSVPSMKMST